MKIHLMIAMSVAVAGCSVSRTGDDVNRRDAADTQPDSNADSLAPLDSHTDVATAETGHDARTDGPIDDSFAGIRPFRVMTFNTGTSESMGHDDPPDDGYTSLQAAWSDMYYGDGLAWIPAVEAATAFIKNVAPDVIVFQEIFHSDMCAEIPEEFRAGFICETWEPGYPTVASVITGTGWQVMCNPGKPDKCAAVNRAFGSFRGCADDFCLEGMDGFGVATCGRGARIGRAVIDVNGGGSVTIVNVHGSSGFKDEEMMCRVKQFDQVFVDFGDGAPAASGEINLIMGDFNTDPGRAASWDASAARLLEYAGPDRKFSFITEFGENVTPTYGGVGNIDHVIGDVLGGNCRAAGITEGFPAVINAVYFDHAPIVCDVSRR